ncbi:MAG: peptide chain release factor H [Rhodanobacteraceae bacterium]
MLLLQLSAAHGPAECALAVAKGFALLQREALAHDIGVDVIEAEAGPEAGTWRSLVLTLDGADAAAFALRWSGTLLWICPSPYRPAQRRKNWFFGGRVFALPELPRDGEVRFEAVRASGPGGQHVNKTASAVRATHVATGISVKVQSERSQQANKRLALALIRQKLADRAEAAAADQRTGRHEAHRAIDRGNPVRTFRGIAFTPDMA